MPFNDLLNREYTLDEARFWREAQYAAQARGSAVRLVPIGQQFGYDEQRIGQVGRTWQNDDLCITSQSGRVIAALTSLGHRFTFEDNYSDLEG